MGNEFPLRLDYLSDSSAENANIGRQKIGSQKCLPSSISFGYG
jgi:hypothetical protein